MAHVVVCKCKLLVAMPCLFFSWHVCVAVVSRSASNCEFPDAAHDDQNIVEIDKSNVLLMGPTGSG